MGKRGQGDKGTRGEYGFGNTWRLKPRATCFKSGNPPNAVAWLHRQNPPARVEEITHSQSPIPHAQSPIKNLYLTAQSELSLNLV